MKVSIYLKGGQTVRVKMNNLTIRRNPFDGSIDKIEWDKVAGKPQLFHVNLNEIAAIVTE